MLETSKKSVSVVVPFCEPFDLDLFDLTLFSLIGQNEVSLEIIVLVLGGESQQKKVSKAIERHSLEPSIKKQLKIQCIDSYGLEAWRLAWNLAESRYFCVLETNSVLYLNALSTLIDEQQKSMQAFAFGAEKRSFYVREVGSSVFHVVQKQLLCNEDNYLSIFCEKNISLSSCLIDRTQVDSKVFNRISVAGISDSYQLLLNLFGNYPSTTVLRNVPLSESYFRNKEQLTKIEKLQVSQLKSNRVLVSIAEVNQAFLEINEFKKEARTFPARIVRKLRKVFLQDKAGGEII